MDLATGMEERAMNRKISIYPNPVTDRLYIDGLPDQALISIYNLLGQDLHSIRVKDPACEIDLQHLEPGIYMMTVEMDGGKEVLSFVKSAPY